MIHKCLYCLQEEELAGAILVVLANKQDMDGCMTVAEVHHALGLENLKNRTFQIFKTSATKGEGLDQAMDWLSNTLQSRKQSNCLPKKTAALSLFSFVLFFGFDCFCRAVLESRLCVFFNKQLLHFFPSLLKYEPTIL